MNTTGADLAGSCEPVCWGESSSSPNARFKRSSDIAFRLHCLNRHTINVGLLCFTDYQGFLITGQHSGTHWIKWMMSHALAHRYGVAPPRYMNNSSSNELIGHPKHPRIYPTLPRVASSHTIPPYALDWRWLRHLHKLPPYVVVVRDVRDILISHFAKWRATYKVSFEQYLAGDPWGRKYKCDIWWYLRFANRWGEVARRFPEETLVLTYEGFRRDTFANLQRISQHFSLDLTDDDIRAGIAVGSKAVMARHQDPGIAERPVRPDGADAVGYSKDDLALLRRILSRHLRHDFGYHYFGARRGFQLSEAIT
jgi:hypothetical protein